MGGLKAGQSAFIKYDAFPYASFGIYSGTVESVSNTPSTAQQISKYLNVQLPFEPQSSLFSIAIRLDQQQVSNQANAYPLKIGMVAHADILQERKKIWEWLFEPLVRAKNDLALASH